MTQIFYKSICLFFATFPTRRLPRRPRLITADYGKQFLPSIAIIVLPGNVDLVIDFIELRMRGNDKKLI